MEALLGSAAVLLLVSAVLVVRHRRRKPKRRVGLTDEMLRRIQSEGRIEVEEPLDLGEAAAEEERFWRDEPWDEPEPL